MRPTQQLGRTLHGDCGGELRDLRDGKVRAEVFGALAKEYARKGGQTLNWFDPHFSDQLSPEDQHRLASVCEQIQNVRPKESRDLSQLIAWVESENSQASPQARDALAIFSWLDGLAQGLQAKYFDRLKTVCGSALVFLVTYEFYAHFIGVKGNPIMLLFGLLWLLFGYFLLYTRKAKEIQYAYLTVRSAAELVRILAFWRLNGIKGSVADLIPSRQRDRMRLVHKLLLAVQNNIGASATSQTDLVMAREATLTYWYAKQVDYFRGAMIRNHTSAQLWDTATSFMFLAGLAQVAAILLLRVTMIMHEGHPTDPMQWMQPPAMEESHLMEFLVTFAPVSIICAAISEFYAERRGFEAAAKRFEHADATFLGPALERRHRNMSEDHAKDARRAAIIILFTVFVVGLASLCWASAVSAIKVEQELPLTALTYAFLLAMSVMVFVRAKPHPEPEEGVTAAAFIQARDSHDDQLWYEDLSTVGENAALECVDWYVSNEDRVITLPKG